MRQGCVLSATLFNIYSEQIFKALNDNCGINVNGQCINNIRYADDTVLVAKDPDELQNMITDLHNQCLEWNLEINKDKTVCMVVAKKQELVKKRWKIDDNSLKQVDRYTYLGSIITSDGRCVQDIKNRITLGKQAFKNVKVILTNHNISAKIKLKLFKHT